MRSLIIVYLANLALGLAAEEMPAEHEISIQNLNYQGTGCHNGSVDSLLSSDLKAFTFLFSEFVVDTTFESQPKKTCRISIELNHPERWSFGIYSQETRGFAQLPQGTTAVQKTNYSLGNNRNVETGELRLVGPYRNDYQKSVDAKHDVFGWSQCGNTKTKITVDTSIKVSGPGSMTVDSIDGEVKQHYRISWRKCTKSETKKHEAFVKSLYINTLKRHAEPMGKDYWIGRLGSGSTHQQVAYGFLTSEEFKLLILDEIYEEYLGRRIDDGGRRFWLDRFRQGVFLRQIKASILASDEYLTRGKQRFSGTDPERFIQALYMDVLLRSAGRSEVVYWTGTLSRDPNRLNITTKFINSEESHLINLSEWYSRYFHRDLDSSGGSFWISKILDGATDETIQSYLLGSSEYIFE